MCIMAEAPVTDFTRCEIYHNLPSKSDPKRKIFGGGSKDFISLENQYKQYSTTSIYYHELILPPRAFKKGE